MDVSFITPTKHIKDLGSKSDFILALSHLIDLKEENEYEKAVKEANLPIYLDNGLFENHTPEGIETLIKKTLKIKAKIFFAPDTLYNKKETAYALEDAIGLSKTLGVAAVVQAETKEEWLDFYRELCLDPRVSLIGLSILAIPYVYKMPIAESRIECMKDMLKMNIPHKSCHLLGLGDSLKDVIFAKENCPWIKSHDSSSAVWNAFQGKKILENGDVEGGKTPIKVDFSYKETSQEKIDLAYRNIEVYRKLIK